MTASPYLLCPGVVLRRTDTKEADQILTLLTAEHGRISVIARGVKRKGCRYAAAAGLLAYSDWSLYHRGDWYYANEAETRELFSGLGKDFLRLSLGCYFAELTEALTAEGEESGELLRHLLNGLYALENFRRPPELLRAAFELRAMSIAGYEPLLEGCAFCRREEPEEPVLDIGSGVLRCRRCGSGGAGMPLDGDALAAARHVLYGDPKRLYGFTLGEESLRRLSAAAEAFTLAQLERGFRTLDYYQSLRGMEF